MNTVVNIFPPLPITRHQWMPKIAYSRDASRSDVLSDNGLQTKVAKTQLYYMSTMENTEQIKLNGELRMTVDHLQVPGIFDG